MKSSIKRLQYSLIIILAAIIFTITLVTISVLFTVTDRTMKRQMVSLMAVNSQQLRLNIDSYLNEVEDTAALIFSDEAYYAFDATDENLEEYDIIKSEEVIESKIVDLGVMKNFADFGIVYANDKWVGLISQVTDGMFPSGGMYETFASTISNERTLDGWSFGIEGNLERLYYTKKINDNAVLVASFYSHELDNVFRSPDELAEMTIRLIDSDNRILYSTAENEVGWEIPSELKNVADSEENVAYMGANYITTVNKCENGWKVVCSLPNTAILRTTERLKYICFIVAILLISIFIIISLIITRRITRPIGGELRSLNQKAMTDQMTGLVNKASFESVIKERLSAGEGEMNVVFAMFDMDNFKKINDNLGHAKGDEVIIEMAELLKDTFDDTFTIGRIGGDEFAVYKNYYIEEKEAVTQIFDSLLDTLYKSFDDSFKEEKESCELSLSVGVLVARDIVSFEDMYKKADNAMYQSKQCGKGRVTYYYHAGGDADEK